MSSVTETVSDTPRTDTVLNAVVYHDDITFVKLADLSRQLERELAAAKMEEKSLQGFADLWYFAMDKAPGDFERIVTTCQPAMWMNEIAKVRRGER